MCRHVAYVGPPVPLARLLFDAPHGLARQSWAPRDMRGGGTINADGFGVGWYPPGAPPVCYRRDTPLWSDADLPALAATVHCGAMLAAVRSATEGMPVVATAAAPFAEGRWLFSHNGVVAGWPDSVADLAAKLPVRDLLTLPAPTDAALLWALVRDRLRAGADPGTALSAVCTDVAHAAPGSRLNLLLADGTTVAGTAYGHSLWLHRTPDAVTLASEPLDSRSGWRPLPEHHLITATSSTVDIQPLEGAVP